MNDEASLASSYYEIIENLSVIWEETSQDLQSIITNPKHRRRLSNVSSGPIPFAPSSPRLSPRSLDGTPRIGNLRKSPLLKKNVLPLVRQTPISESAVLEESNNDDSRGSVFVTSLRTGELIALPLQDDEYTFESCTTGSDMQSVETIEEYISDEEPENINMTSRRSAKQEPTDDEIIFEIVDELKEELLMIKLARDEAMKALYLHESSPANTQRKTVSRSKEFLSRLSTVPRAPHLRNIGETTDSSSLPDKLPSSEKGSPKSASATSANVTDFNLPSQAEVSSSLDSKLPETDSQETSSANDIADIVPLLPQMLDKNTSAVPASLVQNSGSDSDAGTASQQHQDSALPLYPATSIATPGASLGNTDKKNTLGNGAQCSGEVDAEKSSSELTTLTVNTASQEPTTTTSSESSNAKGRLSPQSDSGATSAVTEDDYSSDSLEENETNEGRPSPDLSSTNQWEMEMPLLQPKQITPAGNFALMKARLQSNFKPSFFHIEHRLLFRSKIDWLAGQRRRVQYNSSRLLLKKRIRKPLKAHSKKMSAEKSMKAPGLPTPQYIGSDDHSIDALIADQDGAQDDNKSLPGRHRPLRRSNRALSDNDLRSIGRAVKRKEVRSKIHNFEDKLERVRLSLSNSSFSSMGSFESESSLTSHESVSGHRDVGVQGNQRPSRGWSSRSFSEGMLATESSPEERKGLTGRLERIRSEKKMNLEKLQQALDSAMFAISADSGS